MGNVTKVIYIILTGLATMLILFILFCVLLVSELSKENSMFAVFSTVYSLVVLYKIFLGISILNIITIACQRIKRKTKVLNFIVVAVVSVLMYISMTVFVIVAEKQAFIEGIDPQNTSFIYQEMSPELSSLVFKGTMGYGFVVIICLKAFLITPFYFKKIEDTPIELGSQPPNISQVKKLDSIAVQNSHISKNESPFEVK